MALFQVLLIVAIISLLLLIVVANSNQSVRQAQQLQDVTEQRLALYSATQFVDLQLLTSNWGLIDEENEARVLPPLNFYGYPMTVPLPERPSYAALKGTIQLQLQNVDSLLSLNSPSQELVDLLELRGIPNTRAQLLVSNLRDYLQREQGLHIQTPWDVQQVPGWTRNDIERIRDVVTARGGIPNYAHAPDALLPVLLRSGLAASISAMRASGAYSQARYSELTGEYDDAVVSLFPGNEQRVTLTVEESGLTVEREMNFDTYGLTPRTRYYGRQYRRFDPERYSDEWNDNDN
ncbi:hypothetical protein C9928_04095 [Pseudidiomarina aestuarii]|uniref:Type II secretion system protein K n=1 Tax=Pseudidiomarina aestuarii TaxID=624146 RepID=A0A2T4CUB4_9GAMM|nr:hypothetical protein C9986_00370 [Pseudidiomarina aestuarii]PTB85131.1 hypothetical protein C9988_02450 [Pseudidiomarina aestuarii]PTB89262.1 hypothetical protein C9928_04095 [Pseudidiomarina aestuarii]